MNGNPHSPGGLLRVLMILPEIPDSSHSGDGLTELGLLETFSRLEGVSVKVLALTRPITRYGFAPPIPEGADSIDVLDTSHLSAPRRFAMGVLSRFSSVIGLGNFLAPWILSREVKSFMRSSGCDLLVGYHWHTAFASASVLQPRLLLVGDPLGEPAKARKLGHARRERYLGFLTQPALAFTLSLIYSALTRLATRRAHVSAFSSFHASQMSRSLRKPVSYFRTPYPQITEQSQWRKRDILRPNKIVLLGQLGGTATSQGLEYFQNKVLPFLMKSLESRAIEILIVGGPDDAKNDPRWHALRSTLGVRFLGHIHPVIDVLSEASVVVVPTSIPLGNRVRILTSWDSRVPVVAHVANQSGIPELAHGYNCLLSHTPRELAQDILTLVDSPVVAETLIEGGSQTLKSFFSPTSIAADLHRALFRTTS